jgi:hypothetical protein
MMKLHGQKLVLLVFICMAATTAQQQPLSPEKAAANNAYQAGDWSAAAKGYEEITAKEPTNSNAWYRLGYSRHHLGDFQNALAAYLQAEKSGFAGALQLHYNKGCALVRLGRKDEAFAALEAAMRAGFNQPAQLDQDEDLVSLRSDVRFAALRKHAERNANPCGDPDFRQFDFWVGEWEVFVQGQQIASSSIQNILNGCVILENWNPRNGSGGKSFNYFDPQVKKWRQDWVAGQPGSAVHFIGERKAANMVMESDSTDAGGTRTLTRMTWFHLGPDTVRQLWEQSTDNGKTWSVAFDGEYRRKK